jgi:hypothetical protein
LVSLLYALVVVFLFWVPGGIFLHGFYCTKYDNTQDAQYNLDRDMKTGAPVLVALLALLLPETTLMVLVSIGIAFEGYLVYSDEDGGAVSKFKRYLNNDEDPR